MKPPATPKLRILLSVRCTVQNVAEYHDFTVLFQWYQNKKREENIKKKPSNRQTHTDILIPVLGDDTVSSRCSDVSENLAFSMYE
jgi:hypothetical protein